MAENLKESELAAILITHLKKDSWDIYPEVSYGYGASRIDIVAKRFNIMWAIEVKTSLNSKVVEQAFDNRNFVHYASVAVLRRRRGYSKILTRFCQDYGLGILEINKTSSKMPPDEYDINQILKSKLNRKPINLLKDKLHPGVQEMGIAGTSNGSYWTPFKQTIKNVKEYLKANNGEAHIKDVIHHVDNHYFSKNGFRTGIYKNIRDGFIKGLQIDNGIVKILEDVDV